MQVFRCSAIGQTKHGQVQLLFEHVFKGNVPDTSAAFMDALEKVYRVASTDDDFSSLKN